MKKEIKLLMLSFLALVLTGFLPVVSSAVAESVTIGGPWPGGELNFLSSKNPLMLLIKRAVTGTLTEKKKVAVNGELPYKLSLADRLIVSPDYRVWSFRARPLIRFNNGQEVLAEDLEFSLKRCLPGLAGQMLESVKGRSLINSSGIREQWVDIKLAKSPKLLEISTNIPVLISYCPIMEAESSRLFGSYLGYGTNIISTGNYLIAGFRSGRDFALHTGPLAELGRKNFVSDLHLRGFRDPRQGLTALRLGSVDMLFTEDSEVLKLARTDPTLSVDGCRIISTEGELNYSFVKRKGFRFICSPDFDLSAIGYSG